MCATLHASPLATRLNALSQIESGDNDNARPDLGRYQVSRKVWKQTTSLPFSSATNPVTCANVVSELMTARVAHFVTSEHRQPTDCEWYCLYHRPAYALHMRRSDVEIGTRFANLCEKLK